MTAILPSSFSSKVPTASSEYDSTTNRLRAAIARKVSMWQLESEAT